jgi:hypothetical protein
MGENLVTVKKWNEIEHSFTTKFGWYDGLRYITTELKNITKGKRSVYELSSKEDYYLIKKLRTVYEKEPTWREKENHK